jgi:hypothetical protein
MTTYKCGRFKSAVLWAVVCMNLCLCIVAGAAALFLMPFGLMDQFGRYRGLDLGGAINGKAIAQVLGPDAAADWWLVAKYLFSDFASGTISFAYASSIVSLLSAVAIGAVLLTSRLNNAAGQDCQRTAASMPAQED